MKRASTVLAFVFGVVLAALAMGVWDSRSVAQDQRDAIVGRYNLVAAESDIRFFVDTQSGRAWQLVAGEIGQEEWKEMQTPVSRNR